MNFEELSRESILLLYQSGELPEEKRAQVEHMLEHDAALREQLLALEAAHGAVTSAFAVADAGSPIPASAMAATTRNTVREIRRWQTERALRPPGARPRPNWRLDWRAYAIASAAAIVLAVGLFVLFGGAEEDGLNSADLGQPRAMEESDDNPIYEQFATAVEHTMLVPALRAGDVDLAEDAMAQLRELTDLSRARDPDLELR